MAMGDAEVVEEEGVPMTAGERLREAREAAGMTLEEIATTTRIPTRHLESLENSDFERLPAPTYTIGFAKNFAGAVGLDRAEIGDQLRTEMGGSRPTMTTPEVFEPADPARAMPIWLIAAAIGALLLFALLFSWLNNRSLEAPDDEVAASNVVEPAVQAPIAAAPQNQGPIVITANDNAWIEVKDGALLLKQGELAAGETFEVPPNAVAPTLTTAKPEALRISVGTAIAPAIGEAGKKVTTSLKADDLLRPRPAAATVGPQPAAPPPQTAPARVAPSRRPAASTAPAPAPAPPPATEPAANSAVPATQSQ
jgi:cytoskeleton protein RodZ